MKIKNQDEDEDFSRFLASSLSLLASVFPNHGIFGMTSVILLSIILIRQAIFFQQISQVFAVDFGFAGSL